MPLFWNSIFRKSSFKCKTRFWKNRVIANVDLEKKKFMELEFHESTRVPCKVLEFTITQLSKNRVLNWNLIFRKSNFKTGVFSYLVWERWHFTENFVRKGQMPILAKFMLFAIICCNIT